MSLFFMILGMILLVFYIREKISGYTLKGVFLKTLLSVLFVSTAVAARSSSILAPFLTMGLLFGLLGDIWLDLKYVFPPQDELFTYAGFSVFGIGHILYVSGLLLQYGSGLFLIPSILLAAIAAGLILLLEKPMKLSYGKMKPIVLIYGFLLFSTVFVSGGLFLMHKETTLLFIFIGSVLFAISDLVLSGTYFGIGKSRPIDIISNYIFYYTGQFLIAFSLTFLR